MGRPKNYTPVDAGPTREAVAADLLADGVLNVSAAGKFCCHGRRWIFDQIANGQLASFMLGGRRVVARKVLIAFLAKSMLETK